MLGNIEEAIIANYKKALENGNLEQAKKATELALKLRELVEYQGFEDIKKMDDSPRLSSLSLFKPITYSYDSKSATIILYNELINLTEAENKLFMLFTQNETTLENIKLIQRNHIKNFVWPNKNVTNNAVRILIKRLRAKIEASPSHPEFIVNFNRKGYVFLGKSK